MNIEIVTKTDCPWCEKAKNLLDSLGKEYNSTVLDDEQERKAFYDRCGNGVKSVPQIFIDDVRIGGYTDLLANLDKLTGRFKLDDPSVTYKPFRYPWAVSRAKSHEQTHWIEDEIPLGDDVNDWKGNKLTKPEKEFISNILKLFTQSDCYSSDTDILTKVGWVNFKEVTHDHEVAAYNSDTGVISFEKPLRVIVKPYEGDMLSISSQRSGINLLVTPDHDILYRSKTTKKFSKSKAKDVKFIQGKQLVTSGVSSLGSSNLTDYEKLRIAFQADGSLKKGVTGDKLGYIPHTFSFIKDRKITRLKGILDRLNIPHSTKLVTRDNGVYTEFRVHMPEKLTKSFDWVDLSKVNSCWANEFAEELTLWDGHCESWGNRYYSNTDKEAANQVSAILTCGGIRSYVYTGSDNRSEKFSTIYKVFCGNRYKRVDYVDCQHVHPEYEYYSGNVHCVTVSTGNIVVRRKGKPVVSGNCAVASNYYNYLIPKFKNNEVRMMLGSFANIESIHMRSYALLNETLGFPDSDWYAFLEYEQMRDKAEFITDSDIHTKKGTALALAKNVFSEGVMLFASFAMLLNFERFGKMKGMCKIVEFSIRDEDCLSPDTEFLTESGWKLFDQITPYDKLAQYDTVTEEISFAPYLKKIKKHHEGEMVLLHNDTYKSLVTPNHRVIYHSQWYGKNKVSLAENFVPGSTYLLPRSGKGVGSISELTPLERLNIALQADGSIDERAKEIGKHSGSVACNFRLSKQRKIDRLTDIVSQISGATSKEGVPSKRGGNVKDIRSFRVTVPLQEKISKDFSWVNLSDKSSEWAKAFIKEVVEWDGHKVNNGRVIYCNTNKADIDVIQSVCVLAGFSTHLMVSEDTRKEHYKTYYRLSIRLQDKTRTGSIKKTKVPYSGDVVCFTMPKGTLVTRYKNCVTVTGNCHATGIAELFRTYISENPKIWNDETKKAIYEMAKETVRLEDAFIDMTYALGEPEDLKKEDVKLYVRYITDQRLHSLGMKAIFNVEKNPLPWIDLIVGATKHTNFFESRVTDYSVAGLEGDWGY